MKANDYPVFKIFKQDDLDNPVTFKGEVTAAELKRWVHEVTDLYIGEWINQFNVISLLAF